MPTKEATKKELAQAVTTAAEERAAENKRLGLTAPVLEKRAEMTTALVVDVQSFAELQGKTTSLLKEMAEHMVAFRSTFRVTVKGEIHPDWDARGAETRSAIAKVYEAAGLKDGAEAKKLTDALRYHIGNAVRPAMVKHYRTKDKAEAVMGLFGLKVATPKERIGATQGRTATGGGATATSALGKVTVPGVTVGEAASSLAIAVAKSMAQTDALGCVVEAESIVTTARAFGIPEAEEDRAALVAALGKLALAAQAWAGEIALYVAPEGGPLVMAGTEGAVIHAAAGKATAAA